MSYIIIGFYITMVLYHVISVIILHNIWYENITAISIARDALWTLIVAGSGIYYYKHIIPYLHKRKYVIGLFWATVMFSIGISRVQNISVYNMFIGIKYWFMFFRILLSSLFIGHTLSNTQIQHIKKRLPRIIAITIIGWLVRQACKYIWPDIFYQLWYGPIGDFIFGKEPPIYYRTWPWGEPRLQWLFAWPNNYGYFLAALFPFLLAWKKKERSKNQKLIRIIVIIITWTSIALTLSRTAIIWAILGTIILYRNTIKKHKSIVITALFIAASGIIGLSILKWWSTQEHIINKLWSIQYIIQKPLGYGLWTAGPAVHHEWYILPENYYLQIAIDIGSLWFILFICTVIALTKNIKKLDDSEKSMHALMIGLYILLIMWLLLHVFEDSMVNYLFFIPRGIYIGHQSKQQIL